MRGYLVALFGHMVRTVAVGTAAAVLGASGGTAQAPTDKYPEKPINRDRLKGGLAASDDEVKAAMRFAFETFKIVVEPGGAVALAAVLAGRLPTRGRTIAVVVSGGNADPATFADIIKAA